MADIACNLARVSGKKVDSVLVWEEHVTGRWGHHHPAEGGGGRELSCPAQPPHQVEVMIGWPSQAASVGEGQGGNEERKK